MPDIYFEEKGSGPALVLLHGFCETHSIWEKFSARLPEGIRVIMPDLPGFGNSPLPSGAVSIEQIANDIIGWLDDQMVEQPIVIGHSLGGYVTLAMAGIQPEKFPGIGLFHSTAYADTDEKKENRNKVIDFVTRNGPAPFIETFVPGLFFQKKSQWVDEVYRIASTTSKEAIVAYAGAMRDRPERIGVMENFQGPILTIAGQEDPIIPYEQSSAQSKRTKFPTFLGLKGVAHMGMYEAQQESANGVKEFVNRVVRFRA